MNLKALVAAPLVAWLMIASAQTLKMPDKWSYGSSGQTPTSYKMGIDPTVTWNGKPALTIQAADQRKTAHGNIHQYVNVAGYEGKRVRFSGVLKTTSLDGWAGAYLVADKNVNSGRNFNLQDLPPATGSRSSNPQWWPVSVVIEIPSDAAVIRMGLIMVGNGQVWLSDLRFEEVGADVPLTAGRVEIDQALVLQEQEEAKTFARQQPKKTPFNLELLTN